MQQYLLRSVWIAFRIWLLAVFVNAVIGTVILSFSYASIEIFFVGCLLGGICALPVLLTQMIVVYIASSTGATGRTIFIQAMIAGELATIVVLSIFFIFINEGLDRMMLLLAACALVSGALATFFHIGTLHEMGSDHDMGRSIVNNSEGS